MKKIKSIKYIFMIIVSILLMTALEDKAQAYSYNDMKQTADGWIYRSFEKIKKVTVYDYVGTEIDVYVPESIDGFTVQHINTTEFNDSNIKILHIPKYVEYITYEMFGEDALLKINTLEQIIVDEANPYYKSIDGVLYSKDEKKLVRIPIQRTGTYIIPDTVELVEGSAFSYTGLTGIHIGKKVKTRISINECEKLKKISVAKENRYFSAKNGVLYNKKKTRLLGCAAEKKGYFKVPNSVKYIERQAFKNCKKLTKVKISDNVKYFGSDVFWKCSRLKEVILGKRTKLIGSDCFVGTRVKKLIVPKSVNEIAEDAFYNSSSLKKIIIKGKRLDIRKVVEESVGTTFYVPKKALKWYKKQLKDINMGDNKLVGI